MADLTRAAGVLILFLSIVSTSFALEDPTTDLKSLDEQVQEIKKDVLAQTVELRRLEEKLLYPSNSQVSVFVSLTEDNFNLDSVEVKMDNKVVAKYLYDFREQTALRKGGVQRIYTGNVHTGDHSLVVSIAGKPPEGGPYKRNATYTLNKGVGPKFVEIKVSGSSDIKFQDW